MIELVVSGLSLIIAFVLVYGFYYFSVLGKKGSIAEYQKIINRLQKPNGNLERVSIIVNTFNEAGVIERKLENIAALDYPMDKIEVVVFDDASVDGTAEIAGRKMREQEYSGQVLRNPKRIGLNRSLNEAVAAAKNNLVCITDSDVLLEKDSLKNSVRVLLGFDGAGGVTGKIHPVFGGSGAAQSSENSYRSFYHTSMLAESSLHSAFPGNGPLIVYDKSKVRAPIPLDYGSTDGNIAMNIIKAGFRFLYVPNAIIFEPVAENLSQQRLQKVRRAKRLLQVFELNRNIGFNRKYGVFGARIFPLKFLMLAACPLLLFAGLSLLVGGIILSQNIFLWYFGGFFAFLVVSFSLGIKWVGNLISSFVLHQFYLLIGLFSSIRKSVYWKTIDRNTKIDT